MSGKGGDKIANICYLEQDYRQHFPLQKQQKKVKVNNRWSV